MGGGGAGGGAGGGGGGAAGGGDCGRAGDDKDVGGYGERGAEEGRACPEGFHVEDHGRRQEKGCGVDEELEGGHVADLGSAPGDRAARQRGAEGEEGAGSRRRAAASQEVGQNR